MSFLLAHASPIVATALCVPDGLALVGTFCTAPIWGNKCFSAIVVYSRICRATSISAEKNRQDLPNSSTDQAIFELAEADRRLPPGMPEYSNSAPALTDRLIILTLELSTQNCPSQTHFELNPDLSL
jgi:hypothetical protein